MPKDMPERSSLRWLLWTLPALAVVALDQFTKQWVSAVLQPAETLTVMPFFKLVLWFNTGAAFSFLADAGGWQRLVFVGIAVIATAVILWLLRKHPEQSLFCAGLSLILGGALGNLWDRVLHGHVVDFLLFHAGTAYFPAFNIADSAITVGAGMIIFDGFFPAKRVLSSESDQIERT
jgi:signal peptidase II